MTDPPRLLLPADVAAKAQRVVRRQLKSWLFGEATESLTVRLGGPSEAVVAAHRAAVEAWVRAWQRSPLEVHWEDRRWPSLGGSAYRYRSHWTGPIPSLPQPGSPNIGGRSKGGAPGFTNWTKLQPGQRLSEAHSDIGAC